MRHGFAFGLALFVALSGMESSAHKMRVFAAIEGEVIKGGAYMSKGAKAMDCPVKVFDAAGQLIGETKTDAKGEFEFRPTTPGAIKFVVNGGDGHMAEYVTSPDGIIAPVASGKRADDGVADKGHEALSRQVFALAKQLDEYEEKTRLRDIIGGVGYIFGLAGLWALARRPRDKK